ncbi:MAG: hypothetical protein ACLRY5_11040 [Zhenhengia sp.]
MLKRSKWYIKQSLKVGVIVVTLGTGGMYFNSYANELTRVVSQNQVDTGVVVTPKSSQEDTKNFRLQVTIPTN